MPLTTLTYRELRELATRNAKAGGKPSLGSLANFNSALSAFMAQQGRAEDRVIGSDLRASFYDRRAEHRAALEAAGRPAEYIRNRLTLLTSARRLVLEADREAAAAGHGASPFQSALMALFAKGGGHTVKGTSRLVGMPLATLRRWLDGAVPRADTVKYVDRLEHHFGLPDGALADLLPQGIAKALGGAMPAPESAYRKRLGRRIRERYALKHAGPALRQQWFDLLRHKTAHSLVRKQRARTGRWNLTSLPVAKRTEGLWYAYMGEQYCASAAINWSRIAEYLGWLTVPRAQQSPLSRHAAGRGMAVEEPLAGMGLPQDEVQTLAHLASVEHVSEYVDWRERRSGHVAHGGIESLLKTFSSLCHPVTGYLTQSGESILGTSETSVLSAWATKCRETYDYCKQRLAQTEWQPGESRKPFEAIEGLLEHADPLVPYRDGIARLNASRPATGGMEEAIWFRDRLLMKFVLSNPLRAKNLYLMRVGEGDHGELWRDATGTWVVRIPRREFKNFKGAAKTRDYCVPVHADVVPDLEKYIHVYRPILLGDGEDLGYLFPSSENPTEPWEKLSDRYRELTRRHITGCPGFGLHTARHLVGCTILKKASATSFEGSVESAWAIVAAVLHDREDTVRQHYARFGGKDIARLSSIHLNSAFVGV